MLKTKLKTSGRKYMHISLWHQGKWEFLKLDAKIMNIMTKMKELDYIKVYKSLQLKIAKLTFKINPRLREDICNS